MARRGRKPIPRLQKDGTYNGWHPGLNRYVKLGTRDYNQAVAILAGFRGEEPPEQAPLPEPEHPPAPPYPYTVTTPVLDLDDEKPSDAASLLSSWASGSTKPIATPDPPKPSIFAPAPAPTALAPSPKPGPTPKGLTPEQTAKIAGGLKKIVTNLNIVAVGAAIQMFGRVPAPLDDEEISLLQMGWELYLDELFAKKKLKPIYLVFAGNLMIAFSMYVGGTDKPKKELPKADSTKAKSSPLQAVPPTNPQGVA